MNEKNAVANVIETGKPSGNNAAKGSSRRKFLGQIGAALAGGAVLGKAAIASAQDYNSRHWGQRCYAERSDGSASHTVLRHPRPDGDRGSADSRSAAHDQRRRSALSGQVRHLHQGSSAGWDRVWLTRQLFRPFGTRSTPVLSPPSKT